MTRPLRAAFTANLALIALLWSDARLSPSAYVLLACLCTALTVFALTHVDPSTVVRPAPSLPGDDRREILVSADEDTLRLPPHGGRSC